MDPIETLDYINAFQEAVDTLILCSGYDTPKTPEKLTQKQYKECITEIDEDIFNIECLINELREQIEIIK